jgi:hypothetical protein
MKSDPTPIDVLPGGRCRRKGLRHRAAQATGALLLLAGVVAIQASLAWSTPAGASTPSVPTVTSITPGTGPTTGGTWVTIYGAHLTGVRDVEFGRTPATRFTITNSGEITARSPGHAAGTVDVSIVTFTTTTVTATTQFTYVTPRGPSITSITPDTGRTTGLTYVTFSGADLTRVRSVSFGTTVAPAVTPTVSGELRVEIPPHAAGTFPVSIVTFTTRTVTATTEFTFLAPPAPEITGVSPISGPATGGTKVTIYTSNLTDLSTVFFGTTPASTVTLTWDGVITASAPPHTPGTVPIRLSTRVGTAVAPTAFTYLVPSGLSVTWLTPESGPTTGSTEVTIHGPHVTAANAVTFGSTAASIVLAGRTWVTVKTKAHAPGSVPVSVIVSTKTEIATLATAFTFEPLPPTVTKVTASRGPADGGTTVTVTGTNFTTVTAVDFGTAPGTSLTRVGADQLTVVTPVGTPGPVAVSVTAAGGTGSLAAGFTYVGAPTVTRIAPSSGPVAGGTRITVSGTGLTGATAVAIGTVAATTVVAAPTGDSLTAKTPPGTSGAVAEPVSVTTTEGTVKVATGFHYATVPVAPPNVIASPSDGSVNVVWIVPANGGSPITSFTLTVEATGAAGVPHVLKAVKGTAIAPTPGDQDAYVVTGLSDSVSYTFSVGATNVVGTGAITTSNTVLPHTGFWLAASDGGIFAFGNAGYYGSMGGKPLDKPIVGMAATADNLGYWEVASDGGIFAFGDAVFHGSMGGRPLNRPIVGMAATPTGGGYWEVASDGGIFAFGDAVFHGSMGGRLLNRPIVGMAATPTGGGYWEVASDGGIFAFGNAVFHGSMGGKPLNRPIVAISATRDGGGYWEVASDGGIFNFGDATFFGSAGGTLSTSPVIGIATTGDGDGYWIARQDGSFSNYGDGEPFPQITTRLNAPVVAMTPLH